MSKFANLDVEFMVEAMPLLLKATKMTLFLAIVSLVLAFILGLILASIRYFHVKLGQNGRHCKNPKINKK